MYAVIAGLRSSARVGCPQTYAHHFHYYRAAHSVICAEFPVNYHGVRAIVLPRRAGWLKVTTHMERSRGKIRKC
jgi:hypothetical protein